MTEAVIAGQWLGNENSGGCAMNRFDEVIGWTLAAEGVFANDAWDPGGKTIYGIASNIWPGWYARVMAEPTPEKRIARAKEFYLFEFWQPLRCEFINSIYIAGELFDTGVNMGRATGVTLLQLAVNVIAAQEGGGNVTVDGRIGSETIGAVNRVTKRYELQLAGWQNWFQGERYMTLYKRNPERWDNAIAGFGSRMFVNPRLVLAKRPEFGEVVRSQ